MLTETELSTTTVSCQKLTDTHKEFLTTWKAACPKTCCICLDDTVSTSNPIRQCDNIACDVTCHAECYGVTFPNGPWTCDKCSTSDHVPECILCGFSTGALKKLDGEEGWCHVQCALWIPEVSLHPETMSIATRHVPPSRFSKYCELCPMSTSTLGACLTCSHENCHRSFHVSCALKFGLFEEGPMNACVPIQTDGLMFPVFCSKHGKKREWDEVNAWYKWCEVKREWEEKVGELEKEEEDVAKVKVRMLLEDLKRSCLRNGGDGQEVGLAEKFEHQYALYDAGKETRCRLFKHLERDENIKKMVEQSQMLLDQRVQLETSIRDMHRVRKQLASDIEASENVGKLWLKELSTLQETLVDFFHYAQKQQLDLQKLTSEPITLPETDHPDAIIEFFLSLAPKSEEPLPPNPLRPPPTPSLFSQSPSISPIPTIPTISLPPAIQPSDIDTCCLCETRRLPLTAPVLPAFQDTLVYCTQCYGGFHLCCMEPPRGYPPEHDELRTWRCSYCVAGLERPSGVKPPPVSYETQVPIASKSAKGKSKSRGSKTEKERGPNDVDMDVDVEENEEGDEYKPEKRNYKRGGNASSSSRLANTSSNPQTSVMRRRPSVAEQLPIADTDKRPAIQLPILSKRPTRELSLKVLMKIAGPEPIVPNKNHVRARVFIDEDIRKGLDSNEETERIRRWAMWRVLTNVPPEVCGVTLWNFLEEGCAVGFGRFSDAFSGLTTDFSDIIGPANETDMQIDLDSVDAMDEGADCKGGMKVERQLSRWDGDLYKPLWVRGYGKQKEGYCGLCEPGQWLKTKTSVYWYHLHNFHGVSSLHGDFFTMPMAVRFDQAGMREAECHGCRKWISVQGEKPVNVEEIYWFKHAQKCHTKEE